MPKGSKEPARHVLLTNHSLEGRFGTELFIRDWALYLLRSTRQVTVYSPILGDVAEELISYGIPVVDDLNKIGQAPDIIHGHHHLETVAAMQKFPDVPAVFWCHGWLPWQESPPLFSRIRRYVAVSLATHDRLVQRNGIAPEEVSIIRNFVDTSRFKPRSALPTSPSRALFFSNSATEENGVGTVRAACNAFNITLDVVGLYSGNQVRKPEEILGRYDLVFARGRAALEAMAVGAAVILCDTEGIGGYIVPNNFEMMRHANFGLRAQKEELSEEAIKREIVKYNREQSRLVSEIVRQEDSLQLRALEIIELYSKVLEGWKCSEFPLNSERNELVQYLRSHSSTCAMLQRIHVEGWRTEKSHIQKFSTMETMLTSVSKERDLYRVQAAECERLKLEVSRLSVIEKEFAAILDSTLFRLLLKPIWKLKHTVRRLLSKTEQKGAEVRPSGLEMRNKQPISLPPPISSDSDSTPLLACVVIALNDPPELIDALRSILEQNCKLEILIVNSGGGDPEKRLKAEGFNLRVINIERNISAAEARNIGIKNTTAPLLSFLASDCIARQDWAKHRISAHRSGAHAVASAILPASQNSIFEWLAWTLLFSRRAPGLQKEDALRYGVSYSRRLFELFGNFREELQTGEDTEFNCHIAQFTEIVWQPDVVTLHKGPTSLLGLVADQFSRGQRAAATYRKLHGRGRNIFVAFQSVKRIWSCFRYGWKGAPAQARIYLVLAAPFLLPIGVVYGIGALWERVSHDSNVPECTPRKLIALIAFHNEAHYLPSFLENISPIVDGIIALDDGSTDDSADIISSSPKLIQLIKKRSSERKNWNDLENKRLLIEAAIRYHKNGWVVVVDADERLEDNFREKALAIIRSGEPNGIFAYTLRVRELWNGPAQYRVDGIWGSKSSARLFKVREDFEFHLIVFHGHWAPLNSKVNGAFTLSELNLYHLRMIHAEDRAQRRLRYETLDPNCLSQAIGYSYLTDEKGLTLESIAEDRSYAPNPPPVS